MRTQGFVCLTEAGGCLTGPYVVKCFGHVRTPSSDTVCLMAIAVADKPPSSVSERLSQLEESAGVIGWRLGEINSELHGVAHSTINPNQVAATLAEFSELWDVLYPAGEDPDRQPAGRAGCLRWRSGWYSTRLPHVHLISGHEAMHAQLGAKKPSAGVVNQTQPKQLHSEIVTISLAKLPAVWYVFPQLSGWR
jgi:hypothetical protein